MKRFFIIVRNNNSRFVSADFNFITSLVAHCVTAAVATNGADKPAAAAASDKPTEEKVAEKKEEPKVETKQAK